MLTVAYHSRGISNFFFTSKRRTKKNVVSILRPWISLLVRVSLWAVLHAAVHLTATGVANNKGF